jgi:hypothetical protein
MASARRSRWLRVLCDHEAHVEWEHKEFRSRLKISFSKAAARDLVAAHGPDYARPTRELVHHRMDASESTPTSQHSSQGIGRSSAVKITAEISRIQVGGQS